MSVWILTFIIAVGPLDRRSAPIATAFSESYYSKAECMAKQKKFEMPEPVKKYLPTKRDGEFVYRRVVCIEVTP